MKRLLAALLCASLPLGSVEAAVTVRVLPRATAVPALTVSVPLAAAAGRPRQAREHLAKAAEIAAAHQLPPPALVIPPEAAK